MLIILPSSPPQTVPAHTINFRFVPSSQRLLYINSIQIGYNVFLSFLGNKSVDNAVDNAEKKVTDAVAKVEKEVKDAVKKAT